MEEYSLLGKILIKIGAVNRDKEKIRILHPLGFLVAVIGFPIVFCMSGIFGIMEVKEEFFISW